MKYIQINSENDKDIPYLVSIHKLPEISRYVRINEENYFSYVTAAENVYYFKAYEDGQLAAVLHCELFDETLHMSIIVLPDYQKQGIGTAILYDIQNMALPLTYSHIRVSIEKSNAASLRLFYKINFVKISEDGDLIDFIYSI